MTEVGNNVISLFSKREEKKAEQTSVQKEDVDLLAIAERNRKNDERVAKERASANKSVLRSYRIKH